MSLPIDAILPDLIHVLHARGSAVLQAPPGAGKTTRVPLALLPHVAGRIVMLEPRRIAARAAAERMAQSLREPVGQTIGYRMRGEALTSRATRIEVVTEGILTRMLQSDPDLPGIGAVIFDEFHERALVADLGLALTLEARSHLRPDLWLIVMSATLDAAPVARLVGDAPILTAEGRTFPVETRWLDRPAPPRTRIEDIMATQIRTILAHEDGSILAFLPGEGEIRRTAARLAPDLPDDTVLTPLYGALDLAQQRRAIAPVTQGRKIVLATSIAETALTIDGVRVVVDSGLARRARFDPGSGMTRLVTEPVTRAEAEQRQGRAGRTAPGICYRLWARAEEGRLAAYTPPEITRADLAGFALELALWGGGDDLAFLTAPPDAALTEARSLLRDLGAMTAQGTITAHGRAMAVLPLHPRLAHMLLLSGRSGAELAALLAERDILSGAPCDLSLRLDALRGRTDYPIRQGALLRVRDERARLARLVPDKRDLDPIACAALAYPDRIAQRRKGDQPRYILSGGRGAVLDPADPLAQAPFLVVTDTDGAVPEARIRQAFAWDEAGLRATFAEQIIARQSCDWSRRERRILARQQEMFGALVLSDRPWPDPPQNALVRAVCNGLRDLGLPWTDAAQRFAARVSFLRRQGAELPDLDDSSLLVRLDDWLAPSLPRLSPGVDPASIDILPALQAQLDWDQMRFLDSQAPSHFVTPLGNRLAIDYTDARPQVELRLQEVFGLTTHPVLGPKRVPLQLVLLSPARRPLQVTTDLPGFWASSYADVRKDMRGRYPRHPWPENPALAQPTLRAKPRGTPS